MIKRIYRSKFDIENLSRLRTAIFSGIDTFDYKKIIVNKPWGYEYLVFENPYVAIWILHLKYQFSTSMHCHPTKKTSIIVLSGTVSCKTLDSVIRVKKGEGLIIDEGVFHSSTSTSKDGSCIMEVESPPNKKDLVRLKDEYGRENLGYEGKDKMSKDFKKYEYMDFHDEKFGKRTKKNIKDAQLVINYHSNSEDIRKLLINEKGKIVCLLKGKLHDSEGNIILATGEAALLKEITSSSSLVAFSDIMYLIISYEK